MSRRLLIAGFGDLGQRLAGRLTGSNWAVTGLARSPASIPGIQTVAGDLQGSLAAPGLAGHWDAVIYTATPDERTRSAYYNTYVVALANLLDRLSVGRLILVSSTAVYGQQAGEWVDETSPTEPTAFNGRVLLEAEALASRLADSTVVRFSGIYGPGRDYLLRSLRSGQASCRPDPVQWTNRIHAEDCAGFLAYLLDLAAPPKRVCATDSAPAPRCEVLDWLAHQLEVAAPRRISAPQEAARDQGRRVRNSRMLDTGYALQFPDYRAGYGAMME